MEQSQLRLLKKELQNLRQQKANIIAEINNKQKNLERIDIRINMYKKTILEAEE